MTAWTADELERHPSLATAQPSDDFVALLLLQLRPPPPSTTAELPPLHELEVPDAWLDSGDREAQFWREARSCGVFELEVAMAAAMLRTLLVQNKYLQVASSPPRFTKWPSRDRHQLWATLWLGMRFVCGREYSASEVERVISAHLVTPEPSLVVAVRADLLRRRLLVRSGDGADANDADADANASEADADADADDADDADDMDRLAATVEGTGVGGDDGPFVMSRATVEFVLDGDKLFCIRAAVASRRPWWALPLAAQWVAAPRGEQPVAARRFRCVLLEPDATAQQFAGVAVKFVPVGGASAIGASACVVVEGEHSFAALEGQANVPTLCLEVHVSNTADGGSARLPPLRVDCCVADGTWRMVHCVPMPTGEEICNAGRGAVRCFLPSAVPVVEATDTVSLRKPIAELLETEGGGVVLKGWPRKQKQQAHASLWLSHFLLPERLYRDEEVDWLVATHFTRKSVPDCPQIRKELERCGLVERLAGGGGFRLLEQGRDAALEALPK